MSEELKEDSHLLHDLRASLFQILAIFQIADERSEPLSQEDIDRVKSAAVFMNSLLSSPEIPNEGPPTPRKILLQLQSMFAYPDCISASMIGDCEDRELAGSLKDWSRILLNLAINAHREIERMPDIAPALSIDFSTGRSSDSVVITFSDNGPGVPPELADRLFEEGYTTHESTGIGLASSRGRVRNLGGDLTFDGSYGDGARFHLSIPTIDRLSPQVETTDALSILAVDDDRDMLSTYQRIVALDGHHLVPAHDAAEALVLLSQTDFDVVLLDVRLTEMSGKVFYSILLDQHPSIADRVVFATGDQQSTDTVEFLQKSGRPFLIKPFLIDDLRRALAAGSSRS